MSSPDDDRERIDALLAKADRVVHQQVPRATRPAALPWILLAAGVVVAVVIASSLTGGSDGPSISGQTTGVPLAVTTTAVATTSAIVITLPPNPTTTTIDGASTLAPTTTVSTADAVNGRPARWMSYHGGIVTVLGTVVDLATADKVVRALGGAFGVANVVSDYTVMANAPATDEDPLYAHDAVQFPGTTSSLDIPAMLFLNQLAALLKQNPSVTLDVNAYTDLTASPSDDLALSQARADAVFSYLVASGLSAERFTHTGFGGAAPVADNATSEGQALNRRVEFVLHHLAG